MSGLFKPSGSTAGTPVDPASIAGVLIDESETVGLIAVGDAAGGDLSGTYVNPSVALVGGQPAARIASSAVDDTNVHSMVSIHEHAGNAGSPQAANEIQYTRVWLRAGITISAMRTFITAGANGVRQIQLALYDQVTPTANNGIPNNQVATTAADTPPIAFTGIRDVALTASYLIPASGWYWIAIQVDNAAMSFLISHVYRAGSVPRYEEASGVFTLPGTAGVITQPQSAALYAAAVE